MLKLVPRVTPDIRKPRKRFRRKTSASAMNYFEARPDLIEKLKLITIGGIPMFLPDGRVDPVFFLGGKEYVEKQPLRRRRPSRSVRSVA